MRKTFYFIMTVLIMGMALTAWNVFAQTGDADQKPPEEVEPPKAYIVVKPAEIDEFAERLENTYVQIQDYFGERIERRRFPRDRGLRQYNISGETHFAFTTDHVMGSNMMCFVPRDNAEALAFFDSPLLIRQSEIYLIGMIGERISTREGRMLLFVAERVVAGHKAPPPSKDTKKKPIFFTLEWEVETPRGKRLSNREFIIPEPGRYEIKDPYDNTKKLFLIFKF